MSIQDKTSKWGAKARQSTVTIVLDLPHFWFGHRSYEFLPIFSIFAWQSNIGPCLRYTYFSVNYLNCKECRFLPKIFVRDDSFFIVSLIVNDSHSKHKMQIKASVYVYAFYFGQIWVGRSIFIFNIQYIYTMMQHKPHYSIALDK